MKFKLQIWDTAGQERFCAIPNPYYKDARGILLFCDMSIESGLTNLDNWITLTKERAPKACIILVGAKNDLEAKIPLDVLKVWANERDIPFVSTSAKTGDGVTEAFMRLLKEVVLLNKNDFGKTKVENIANLNNQTSVEPQKKTFCY